MFAPPVDSAAGMIVGTLIYLIVPLVGFLLFLRLRRGLQPYPNASAHTAQAFVVLTTYGGWVLVALTALFWHWSGLASLGAAYLLLLAPLIMPAIAFLTRRDRLLSRLHAAIFWSAAAYVPLLGLGGIVGTVFRGS